MGPGLLLYAQRLALTVTAAAGRETMLLAGDIGGTKTVLALFAEESGPRRPLHKELFPSKDYPTLEAIVASYLQAKDVEVSHAVFGVAGPVVRDRAAITNLPWVLDGRQLEQAFSFERAHLLNDLQAVATAIPILEEEDVVTLHAGQAEPGGTIGVIAPGTGLGQAYLVWQGQRYQAFPSEGGHADFAPDGALQVALLSYLLARYEHVSYERVCSGMGIPNLYAFLQESGRYPEPAWLREQVAGAADPTPLIVRAAQQEQAAIASATLELFVNILAREAGNLALKLLATGGIYLGGGIPPRILDRLQAPSFVAEFQDKGRFRPLLEQVPLRVITNDEAALIGAAQDGFLLLQEGHELPDSA
jgi:glucokinase